MSEPLRDGADWLPGHERALRALGLARVDHPPYRRLTNLAPAQPPIPIAQAVACDP